MKKINKKGQVGLDTAKAVMFAIFVIGIMAFALIVIIGNANDTSVAQTSSGVFNVRNETLITVTETGEPFIAADAYPDVACSTVFGVINATSGTVIPTTNYTQTNCRIAFTTGNSLGINNSNWNVSYSYTYYLFGTAAGNITGGTVGFFSNTTTWFALLAVVIIILIIAIVIFAVNRFGGNRYEGGGARAGL
jgi:uncharacterized integral membrane protein